MAQEVNERLDILGGIKLPSGAAAGRLLGSDASGNASWQNPGAAVPARATRTAAYTTTGNAFTKMPLDTVTYDPNGNWALASNRYVCPSAGAYLVLTEFSCLSTAAAQRVTTAVYKNGSPNSWGSECDSGATGEAPASVVADIIQCNAGDFLELFYWTSVALVLNLGANQLNYMAVLPLGNLGAPTPGQGIQTVGRAYRNAALTVNSWTKIALDTIGASNDPGGNFDVVTNHRYNVPVTGFYQVDGQVAFQAVGTGSEQYAAGIYKNGTLVSEGAAPTVAGPAATNSQFCTVADIILCQAGDYLELWGFSSGSGALVVGTPVVNYLSVVQVGGVNLVSALSPTAQSANYTAGAGQSVQMTGSHNVTLPNAPMNGSVVEVAALTGLVLVLPQGNDICQGYGTIGESFPVHTTASVTFTYLNGTWYARGCETGSVGGAQPQPGAGLQAGMSVAGDCAISGVSVDGVTGAITLTVAAAPTVWMPMVAGPIAPIAFAGVAASVISLGAHLKPSSAQFCGYGVNLNVDGTLSIGNSTLSVSTQAAALTAIQGSLPPAGAIRVADVVITNVSGTYTLSLVRDRRAWSRGAFGIQTKSVDVSTSSTSAVAIDAATLGMRIECTGMPMRAKILAPRVEMAAAGTPAFSLFSDGSSIAGPLYLQGNPAASLAYVGNGADFFFTPAAGSHLLVPFWQVTASTATLKGSLGPIQFIVEEIVRPSANNGTS